MGLEFGLGLGVRNRLGIKFRVKTRIGLRLRSSKVENKVRIRRKS